MSELLKTPLYERQKAMQTKNVSFCGWDMPIQFEGIIAEYQQCRNDVALFDTSHMGEFFFKGDILHSGMNEATTINIDALKVGRCKYGFLLNENGGVLDDLIIYRLSSNELMIVVNAATRENDFATLSARISNAQLEDRSMQYAKLDVQGPHALRVITPIFSNSVADLQYFGVLQSQYQQQPCIISKTGYTGELGFELYVPSELAVTLWDTLLANGAKPAGLGARDLLRLEMGYSLYGNELNEQTTPLEANLEKFINFAHTFTGKEALVAQKEHGLSRLLMPFITESRRSARKDFRVFQNDTDVGVVTSGSFSPTLNKGIGLAMINTQSVDASQPIELRDERANIKAFFTSLPFIKK